MEPGHEDRDTGTVRCSSTKQLLLKYMEGDSGQVWIAKRKTGQDIWPEWIGVIMNIKSWEKDEG